jgi:hypothetical protein
MAWVFAWQLYITQQLLSAQKKSSVTALAPNVPVSDEYEKRIFH